jgi:hypothetical protein
MARTDLSGVPTLLEQLLHHAGGHPKSPPDLLARSIASVVRG